MVNDQCLVIHKAGYKKRRMHDYNIYKETHPVISKHVVNVFDLGFLGVEKDYHNKNHHYRSERREVWKVTRRNKLQSRTC